jgi:predicted RNase H-like nuclease
VRVIGVDGCRGGWLAASVDDARAVTWCWTRDIRDVLHADADAVAIDIPIGLPENGARACDGDARRRLGRRGATVFAAPVRPVLRCASYAEARAVLAARGGGSMSAQAFGIVAAVRQVDDAMSPRDERRVIESHPEVAFATMTGVALAPKRTATGAGERITALRSWRPDIDEIVAVAPSVARPDDVLDAVACAWVAQRWVRAAASVLGDGARDSRGLVMRIVA